MDIGTGKPTPDGTPRGPPPPGRRRRSRRPLPRRPLPRDAAAAIAAIQGRGRCAGRGGRHGPLLSARSSAGSLPTTAGRSAPSARALVAEARRDQGREALHARLQSLDPGAAARLHPRRRTPRDAGRSRSRSARGAGPVDRSGRLATSPRHVDVPGRGGRHHDRPPGALRGAGRAGGPDAGRRACSTRCERLLASGSTAALPAMQGIGYRQFAPVGRGGPTGPRRCRSCSATPRATPSVS